MKEIVYLIRGAAFSIFVIAVIALLGTPLALRGLAAWFGETQMAIPTAVSFMLVSLVVWLLTCTIKRK